MGVVLRFTDRRERKLARDRAESRSEERFQYPRPEPISEVSCCGHQDQVMGTGTPEDTRAAH
jgi:hypothetical protein